MPTVQPPLTALRAFEAAGRHLSFSAAARELNVTPAALSFQIKSLEENLGVPLFRRLNRAVELTEAGRTLLPSATLGFQTLDAGWRTARRFGDRRGLTVTAGPAFTAKWLAPRLFDFAGRHPDIELRFIASLRILDFDRDEVDAAVRFGMGGPPGEGLHAETILREWVTPMMSPGLARRVSRPEDLPGLVEGGSALLDQADLDFLDPPVGWRQWFEAVGMKPPENARRLSFNQADHALDAAVSGSGVVLGRISLAERDLREGRLSAPFETALTTRARYRFVCPERIREQPRIAAFRDWIVAEARSAEEYNAGRRFVAAGNLRPAGE